MEWPVRLIQEIARRKCVVFIGAGVSRQSLSAAGDRPPLWKSFLESALHKCTAPKTEIRRHLKNNDFLTACQLIKSRLGEHDWNDHLEAVFSIPHYEPADIHEYIFGLDSPIVATTNIDQIYDRFLAAKYAGVVISKSYHDDAVGRYVKGDPSTRLVLKVHGSVENPGQAIFTREQYADARNKHGPFFETLSSLIVTQTFLFLGYGLSDPDIQLLLENNARLFRSQTPHFFVTSDKPSVDMASMFERNYSIKILRYSDRDDHVELTSSMKSLVNEVSLERGKLAAKQIW